MRLLSIKLFFLLLFNNACLAQQVWTEDTINFVKAAGSPTVPANQDRITSNVWITRDFTGGIYNIAPGAETAYLQDVSPQRTRWAFAGLQGNPQNISAPDFAQLNFSDWRTALGGMNNLLSNIIDRPGVVHLVADDIYIDITFTQWGMGGSGTFAYTRASTASMAPIPQQQVPLPVLTLLLTALGITGFVLWWQKKA